MHPNQTFHAVFDIDDTLIFDDERSTSNVQIKHLVAVVKAFGCHIHLVTARLKNAEIMRWTEHQLKSQGIAYDTLSLCPKQMRASMQQVGDWKDAQRKMHTNCLLTVGDQWSDGTRIKTDADLQALDAKYKVSLYPWLVLKTDTANFFLKLKAD